MKILNQQEIKNNKYVLDASSGTWAEIYYILYQKSDI